MADRGVGDWGSCPGHQIKGGAPKRRRESKNNANLHNENVWGQSGNLA